MLRVVAHRDRNSRVGALPIIVVHARNVRRSLGSRMRPAVPALLPALSVAHKRNQPCHDGKDHHATGDRTDNNPKR